MKLNFFKIYADSIRGLLIFTFLIKLILSRICILHVTLGGHLRVHLKSCILESEKNQGGTAFVLFRQWRRCREGDRGTIGHPKFLTVRKLSKDILCRKIFCSQRTISG